MACRRHRGTIPHREIHRTPYAAFSPPSRRRGGCWAAREHGATGRCARRSRPVNARRGLRLATRSPTPSGRTCRTTAPTCARCPPCTGSCARTTLRENAGRRLDHGPGNTMGRPSGPVKTTSLAGPSWWWITPTGVLPESIRSTLPTTPAGRSGLLRLSAKPDRGGAPSPDRQREVHAAILVAVDRAPQLVRAPLERHGQHSRLSR